MKKLLGGTKIFLVVGILFLLVVQISAGVTGKIVGRVTDASSSEPLIGVNVMVEGQAIGAATDIDGDFIILNIRPGIYTIKASMIGFTTRVIEKVQVFADKTTTIDFQLSEASLSLEDEVVVVAEKPAIQKDQTSTVSTISSADIENMPVVKTTSQFIALMPGVSIDGRNRIHGSDDSDNLSLWGGSAGQGSSDIKTVIDGVLMMNYDGFNGVAEGSSGISDLPKSSVEEISVQTGAMPAEYGNANGGVITMYTKIGGKKYRGWFDYQYDLPGKKHWGANVYDSPMLKNYAWKYISDDDKKNTINPETGELFYVRDDYTSIGGQVFEGSFGGPVPFLPNVNFFVSGRHSALAPIYPSVADRGFIDANGNYVSSSDNFLGTGNIGFNITKDIKIKIGGIINQFTSFRSDYYDPYQGNNIVIGAIRNIDDFGKNIYLPKNWAAGGKQFNRDVVGYLNLTHVLSPTTFYNLSLGYSSTLVDTINVPLITTQNTRIGNFNAGHEGAFWTLSERKRFQIKFDLISQINKYNLVKVGVDGIFFNNYLMQYESSFSGTGRTKYRRRISYYGSGPGSKGVNKPVKPIQLAFYLQDKLEFERLIINIGGRFDYFNPNSKEVFHAGLYRTTMYSTLTRANNAPTEDMPSIFTFSPRLGIAHPLSEKAVIHFSTGVFRQLPDFFWLYGKTYGSRTEEDDDLNNNGKIDPAERYNTFRPAFGAYFGKQANIIRPETSINFEVGADYNFYKNYTVSTVLYFKSETDQFFKFSNTALDGELDALKAISSNDNWFASITNGAMGDVRGVEFSIRKKMSDFFSFSASYNLEWATSTSGGRSISDEVLFADPSFFYTSKNYSGSDWYKENYVFYNNFTIDPETGAEIPVRPTEAEMLEWAEQAKTSIDLRRERDWTKIAGAWAEPLQRARGAAGLAGFYESRSGFFEEVDKQYKAGNPGSYGKVAFVFVLPSNLKLGPKWLGAIFSNLNINYIYKMATGSDFNYRPPNSDRKELRTFPLYTNSDLSISKSFNFLIEATVYVDIVNLFGQKDARHVESESEYVKYGLITAKPTNKYLIKYGDTSELWRYYGEPRRIRVGASVKF